MNIKYLVWLINRHYKKLSFYIKKLYFFHKEKNIVLAMINFYTMIVNVVIVRVLFKFFIRRRRVLTFRTVVWAKRFIRNNYDSNKGAFIKRLTTLLDSNLIRINKLKNRIDFLIFLIYKFFDGLAYFILERNYLFFFRMDKIKHIMRVKYLEYSIIVITESKKVDFLLKILTLLRWYFITNKNTKFYFKRYNYFTSKLEVRFQKLMNVLVIFGNILMNKMSKMSIFFKKFVNNSYVYYSFTTSKVKTFNNETFIKIEKHKNLSKNIVYTVKSKKNYFLNLKIFILLVEKIFKYLFSITFYKNLFIEFIENVEKFCLLYGLNKFKTSSDKNLEYNPKYKIKYKSKIKIKSIGKISDKFNTKFNTKSDGRADVLQILKSSTYLFFYTKRRELKFYLKSFIKYLKQVSKSIKKFAKKIMYRIYITLKKIFRPKYRIYRAMAKQYFWIYTIIIFSKLSNRVRFSYVFKIKKKKMILTMWKEFKRWARQWKYRNLKKRFLESVNKREKIRNLLYTIDGTINDILFALIITAKWVVNKLSKTQKFLFVFQNTFLNSVLFSIVVVTAILLLKVFVSLIFDLSLIFDILYLIHKSTFLKNYRRRFKKLEVYNQRVEYTRGTVNTFYYIAYKFRIYIFILKSKRAYKWFIKKVKKMILTRIFSKRKDIAVLCWFKGRPLWTRWFTIQRKRRIKKDEPYDFRGRQFKYKKQKITRFFLKSYFSLVFDTYIYIYAYCKYHTILFFRWIRNFFGKKKKNG